jgi:hypothetical protein
MNWDNNEEILDEFVEALTLAGYSPEQIVAWFSECKRAEAYAGRKLTGKEVDDIFDKHFKPVRGNSK